MKIFRYFNEKDLNDYEKENGYLSYKNLFFKDSSLILCNNIPNVDESLYDNIENGIETWDDGEDVEIYQYYLIDDYTTEVLKEYTNEIIFYSELLDVYVLGVTHFGTSWDYVPTDIKIKPCEDMQGEYVAYIDDTKEA